MILTLDIETLPTTDAGIIASIAAGITAPAQYKKPESITEWLRDNKEQATKDAVAKTSFDGMYGSIACICYSFDGGEVFSHDANDSDGEEGMLCNFYSHVLDVTSVAYVGGVASQQLVVCGHNVHAFDLPFLYHRSVILGVKPIPSIIKAMKASKYDACIADTMLMWSNDPHKRGSMDRICKALGIPGKGDFDGSMVADTWLTDPQKVIDYCKDDVRRTRAMWERLTFADSAAELRVAA